MRSIRQFIRAVILLNHIWNTYEEIEFKTCLKDNPHNPRYYPVKYK